MNKTLHLLIAEKLHVPATYLSPVGGGSINQTFRISAPPDQFFCKVNSATKFPHLFQKEIQGLQLLSGKGHVKTPGVIDFFVEENQQVLILEWIEEGQRTDAFWQAFGAGLAALHQTGGEHFGLDHDNYMGSVAQTNTPTGNWISFFTGQRLQPLVKQCADQQLLDTATQVLFEGLYLKLPEVFAEEPACLLHGDLWNGNFMCSATAQPVLIDPAVYFGHRSMDLGMTNLFGGFP